VNWEGCTEAVTVFTKALPEHLPGGVEENKKNLS